MNQEYKFYSLGCDYYAKGNYAKALDYFNKTIAINPNSAPALNNLGNIYKNTHDYSKALKYYQQALKLLPNSAIILTNIGVVQKHWENWKVAIEYFIKAIYFDPNYFEAYYNLGISYYNKDNYQKAIDSLEKAIKINPNFDHAKSFLTFLKMQVCDWHNIPKYNPLMDSPIFSISRYDDPKVNLKTARYWSSLIEKKMETFPKFIHHKTKKNKLTIGYVSNDFYNHATSYLINGLFKNHDKNKFNINIYSYGPTEKNYYLNKFKKEVNKFIDISKISDFDAAQKIYLDGVDILIDLKGFTGNTRLEIFALKPAPIQVAWLGFPGTTGASFIDYIITDKIVSPKNQQKYFSEKFAYLPCYQINDDQRKIHNLRLKNQEPKTSKNKIIFCCFARPTKIEPKVFKSWTRILKKVPNSVLWLWKENNLMVKNLKKAFSTAGLNPARLIFLKSLPVEKHLARLKEADIALDTFVYNGHTTTSDCLWAGIPVVTLQGKHFASRVSSSLLTAVGLPELITHSTDEYEKLATQLATNSKKLRAVSYKLQANIPISSLFNTKLFVKNLEELYLKIKYKLGF